MRAFLYWRDNAAMEESIYPYEGKEQTCMFDAS